jgi:hypothetical protein
MAAEINVSAHGLELLKKNVHTPIGREPAYLGQEGTEPVGREA